MSNSTQGFNLTSACKVYESLQASFYIDFVFFVLSTSTFIIGLVSWIKIRKFRAFKNYVLLCVIFNYLMNTILRNIDLWCIATKLESRALTVTMAFTYLYFKLTTNYWLLVLFYLFYLNIVRVFNNHITRRYLKANFWAWGVPFVINIWNVFIMPYLVEKPLKYTLPAQISLMFVPLVINVIIYVVVVYQCLKSNDIEKAGASSEGSWRFVKMLTAIFILSGVFMLIMPLRQLWLAKKGINYFFLTLTRLQDLTLDLYFLMQRENWSLWKDYFMRRRTNAI